MIYDIHVYVDIENDCLAVCIDSLVDAILQENYSLFGIEALPAEVQEREKLPKLDKEKK